MTTVRMIYLNNEKYDYYLLNNVTIPIREASSMLASFIEDKKVEFVNESGITATAGLCIMRKTKSGQYLEMFFCDTDAKFEII